jgi:hypothetical protein
VSAGIDMALLLAARLTDEATARRVQLALDYNHVPPLPRAIRGAISLTGPLLAARARRLTRAGR